MEGTADNEQESQLMFEDLNNVFAAEVENVENVVETETEVVTDPGHMGELVEEQMATAEDIAVASIQMDQEVDITEEAMQGHEFLITTDGCFLPQPAENAPDVEVSLEDQLKSSEKLDRSSPDLWPTNLPTTAKQILYNNQLKTGETDTSGGWAQGLDPEDINLLHQFGSLTSSSLVEEVKKLQNIAYQLGLDERKEITRGKLLHVLGDSHTINDGDHVKQLWK